ncbi:MAG: putative inner membrane protein [Ignavibacteriae bacterium]|nr:MAG: putative inner membrane protein [Ignavibacteriota bacterium]
MLTLTRFSCTHSTAHSIVKRKNSPLRALCTRYVPFCEFIRKELFMKPTNIVSTFVLVLACSFALIAQERQYNPTYGPAYVTISNANVGFRLPEGYFFLEAADATAFMREFGNPSVDIDALVAPTDENADWYIYFKFSDLGYFKMEKVKEELEDIDLIGEIRKNTELENQKRAKAGFPTIQVVGYAEKLSLNTLRQTLDFAIESVQEGRRFVERRSLMFGRKGLLLCSFVCSKERYLNVQATFNNMFASISFQNNYRYADFNPGVDKYAAVGIGTVLVGRKITRVGWLSKTLKSLGKAIWAFIVGIFAAIWGFLKRLFGKKEKPALVTGMTQTKESKSQNGT